LFSFLLNNKREQDWQFHHFVKADRVAVWSNATSLGRGIIGWQTDHASTGTADMGQAFIGV